MKLHRDLNNRLVASLDVDASECWSLVSRLVHRFELVPVREATQGLDVAFREFASGEQHVSLEWDNWMGFQVVALSVDSEALVERIAEFVTA